MYDNDWREAEHEALEQGKRRRGPSRFRKGKKQFQCVKCTA